MNLSVDSAHGARRMPIEGGGIVVGRDPSCDLVLDDPNVSRRHLTVEPHDTERVLVRDLDSSNGTFVNGQRVTGPTLAGSGDRIGAGSITITLALPDVPSGATAVAAITVPPPPPPPDIRMARSRPPGAEDSVVLRLRRSVRRSTVLAFAALLALGGLAVLMLTDIGPFGGEPRVEEIVEAVAPATLIVASDVAGGTGWVYDADEGMVVTNHHVVATGKEFVVGVDGEARPATLVGTAPCEDLAVLRLDDTTGLRAMALGSQDELRLGQTVVAIGYPESGTMESDLTATTGVVSVVRASLSLGFDTPDFPNVVQTDAAINPGNSGGPLVDLRRRLVGVNTASRTVGASGRIVQGQGFAVGVDRVLEVVPELTEGLSRGWTGALLEVVGTPQELTGRGLPLVDGLLLTGALPGTEAARAGLEDATALLVAIDGTPLDGTIAGYCTAVGRSSSGDQAVFTLVPPGTRQAVDVRVGFE